MPAPTDKTYTSDHEVRGDGSVAFACSTDAEAWRWLAIAPGHPVFIQTFNYFISVECSAARGTLDPSRWSALTWMDWEIGDSEAQLPVRGVMENRASGDKLGFALWLEDAAGRMVLRTNGKGVVFRSRDFEGWRKSTKQKVAASGVAAEFVYADRAAVGALPGEHSLLAPIEQGAQTTAQALVTEANGMPPGSRYLDGSGDHVNAVHLAEAGRQFCALLLGEPGVQLVAGEISFTRYVEFDVPFQIALKSRDGDAISMTVDQGGKPCTSMIYRIA